MRKGFYGPGNGSILLDDLNCVGTEANLFQCDINDRRMHDCDHSEDAGVRCGGMIIGVFTALFITVYVKV